MQFKVPHESSRHFKNRQQLALSTCWKKFEHGGNSLQKFKKNERKGSYRINQDEPDVTQ